MKKIISLLLSAALLASPVLAAQEDGRAAAEAAREIASAETGSDRETARAQG